MRIHATSLIVVASLWAGATAGAQSASDATNGPRFEISSRSWNFGTVWQNDPAVTEVTITNAGTAPLTIKTRSSCGCTVATDPRSPLPPGESDVVKIGYDTLKRTGRATQTITFNTNDPQQPSVVFSVQGQVRPIYRLVPASSISFGSVYRNVDETRSLRLLNTYTDDMDAKIKPSSAQGPYEYEFETLTPGKEYRLRVRPKAPLPVGPARGFVMLETGLERLPQIRVPVFAAVQPPISVLPTKLRLPRASVMTMQLKLRVLCNPEDPVRVVSVKPSIDVIRAEVVDLPAGEEGAAKQEILVDLPPGDRIPSDAEPAIEITTDCSEQAYRRIVVPVEMIGPRPTGG